ERNVRPRSSRNRGPSRTTSGVRWHGATIHSNTTATMTRGRLGFHSRSWPYSIASRGRLSIRSLARSFMNVSKSLLLLCACFAATPALACGSTKDARSTVVTGAGGAGSPASSTAAGDASVGQGGGKPAAAKLPLVLVADVDLPGKPV